MICFTIEEPSEHHINLVSKGTSSATGHIETTHHLLRHTGNVASVSNHERRLVTGSLSASQPNHFLIQPRHTCLGIALPTVGWAFSLSYQSRQSLIHVVTGQSGSGSSSVEILSSQVTQGCVNQTNNSGITWDGFLYEVFLRLSQSACIFMSYFYVFLLF